MSPEQLRATSVDARTDIFSLAVVAWEALAGRALFDRASDYETVMAVAEAEVPVLPGDDPVAELLDAVLRRALARDRTHRHGSAREFADDLRRTITAYGAPMTAIEIQAHFSTWLGASLARRGRELAALLGGWRQLEEMTDERTLHHEPAPVTGVRLRDVSVAVGYNALEATRVIKGISAANSTDTITELMLTSVTEPLDVAMITTSSEWTLPRTASPGVASPLGMTYSSDTAIEIGPTLTVDVPGLAMREPTTEDIRCASRVCVSIQVWARLAV